MNPVICTDNVNSVVRAEICAPNCQVINLNIDSKVEHNVKLRTVNKDQVVNRGIDRRNEAYKPRSNGADRN